MNKVDLYSARGTKKTQINLPKDFGDKPNIILLAQAIRVYESNMHIGKPWKKTRSEVNFSTRKIYRQKGTGGARHGAKSAPIFVGGGLAHGPKGKKRRLTLSKKMVKKALNTALSLKLKEKQLVVIEGITTLKKTSEGDRVLRKIFENGKSVRFTLVLDNNNLAAKRIFRNIDYVKVISNKVLNAYDVYYGGFLIFDKDIFAKPSQKEIKK